VLKLTLTLIAFFLTFQSLIGCGGKAQPEEKTQQSAQVQAPVTETPNRLIPPVEHIEDDEGNVEPVPTPQAPEVMDQAPQLPQANNPGAPPSSLSPSLDDPEIRRPPSLPTIPEADTAPQPVQNPSRPEVMTEPPEIPNSVQPNSPTNQNFSSPTDVLGRPIPSRLEPLRPQHDHQPVETFSLPSFEGIQTEEIFPTISQMSWHSLGGDNPVHLTFDCEDCPSSFTSLVISSMPNSSGRRNIRHCQGVLISDDVVLTNRHCLSADLLQKGVDCSDRIRMVFHKLSDDIPGKVGHCEQVLDFDSTPIELHDVAGPDDWALLKLQQAIPNRATPPRLTGLSDNETLYYFAPVKRQDQSVDLRVIQCRAEQQPRWQAPHFVGPMNPTAALYCNHPTRQGFSGGPTYVFENGVWQPVAIRTFFEVSGGPTFQENNIDYYNARDMNLSCIPSLNPEAANIESCQSDYQLNYDYRQQILMSHLQPMIDQAQQEFMSQVSESNQLIWGPLLNGDVAHAYQGIINQFSDIDEGSTSDSPSFFGHLSLEQQPLISTILSPFGIQCVDAEFARQNSRPGAVGKIDIPVVQFGFKLNLKDQLESYFHLDSYTTRMFKLTGENNLYFLRRTSDELPPGPEDHFARYNFSSDELPFPTCHNP
jgi:hypothetical protein